MSWQFHTDETSGKQIGLQVQDTGLVQVVGNRPGVLQAIGPDTPSYANVKLDRNMSGKSITLLARLEYDPNLPATLDPRVRFDGEKAANYKTLMNVWVDPDKTAEEGSGLTAGDMYAVWNAHSFRWLRQVVENLSTPTGFGVCSIVNTTILTGADATFAQALDLALQPAEPALLRLKSMESSITMEFAAGLDREPATDKENCTIALKGGGFASIQQSVLRDDKRTLTLGLGLPLVVDGSNYILEFRELSHGNGKPFRSGRIVEFSP